MFEFHHILSRHDQTTTKKGNNIALKSTKSISSSIDIKKFSSSDDNTNPDEQEMVLLAKRFTKFFCNKNRSSSGVRIYKLSKKDSIFVKKDDDSKDESDRQRNGCHVSHIKFFKHKKPCHIIANYLS